MTTRSMAAVAGAILAFCNAVSNANAYLTLKQLHEQHSAIEPPDEAFVLGQFKEYLAGHPKEPDLIRITKGQVLMNKSLMLTQRIMVDSEKKNALGRSVLWALAFLLFLPAVRDRREKAL